ncbi:hypothetical protein MLD38_034451 [Melastoma candidum]|uniref:Uncharacterized protein n=1 Tax=Melastoma candidum TaxID=119954 RepID=A0ACB9M9R4_9MYRT|nr:hypothetical protein MLD38_034451 [Melastoma candidum]
MTGETDPPLSQSPASSPAREFSFAVSLGNSLLPKEKPAAPEQTSVDLSPADDIFFHGYLLPLRLLPHRPSSFPPRDSSDSFTLPVVDDLANDDGPAQFPSPKKSAAVAPSRIPADTGKHGEQAKRRNQKSKTFSLFGLQRRREMAEAEEDEEHGKQGRRKLRFDGGQVLQALKSMVKPFSKFRSRTEDEVGRRSGGRKSDYCYSSGNIATKNSFREEVMRRGQYASAPASMRESPANSGILIADIPSPKAANDSTMEELQAAIQAAIAHCKKSIAKEGMKLEDSRD